MKLLGFDIGGTKCAVCVGETADDGVRVLSRRQIDTPPSWRDAVEELFSAGEALLDGARPDACGFSCGGPLDAESGVVLSPPNLPGWDRVPLTRLARERFGAKAYLENDANACALAEWRCGAGRGCRNMVFMTFGTGLGAGLILDGRLIRGANGNAGECGHMRLAPFGPAGYGKCGSFEGFCSGGGIAQLASTMARQAQQGGETPLYLAEGYDRISAKSVAQAALKGDKTAAAVFETCGSMLGEGLAILCDILNPEVVVIGSIFARCEALLRPAMERALAREALPASLSAMRVVPAALGESIGDIAALCVAENGQF